MMWPEYPHRGGDMGITGEMSISSASDKFYEED